MEENQIPFFPTSCFLPSAQHFYNAFFMSANPGYFSQQQQQLPPAALPCQDYSSVFSQGSQNFIDFGSTGINFGIPVPQALTSSSVSESCKSPFNNVAVPANSSNDAGDNGGKSPGDTGFEVEMKDEYRSPGPDRCGFDGPDFQGQERRNFSGTPYARPQRGHSSKMNSGINRGRRGQGVANSFRMPKQLGGMKSAGPKRHQYQSYNDPPPLFDSYIVAISGLPSSATEASIGANFGSVGTIKIENSTGSPKICLEKDPNTGECLGRCLITYGDYEGASSAVACFDGKEFQGSVISVMMNPNDTRPAYYEDQFGMMGNEDYDGRSFRGGRGLSRGRRGGGGGPRGGSNRGGNVLGRSNNGNSGQRREGDWDCYDPECGNRNFAWREVCHRCGLSRSNCNFNPIGQNFLRVQGGHGRAGRGNMSQRSRGIRGNYGNPRGSGGGRAFRGGSRGRSFAGPY